MLGMQMPQPKVGTQNQQQSDANAQKFKNQPYLTLAVLQPACGFKTLDAHLQDKSAEIKKEGYGLVPDADRHLSVMVFAVPFPNGQVSRKYAQEALDSLYCIIDQNKDKLTNVEFEYKKMETLGAHKFLTAQFDRVGKKPFFRVYANIVRSFFNIYPNSWMFYGYGMIPHVSVASKMKAAGAATATTIAGKPKKPIKNLKLRHGNRKLEISARWFDPAQNKLVEIKSNSI